MTHNWGLFGVRAIIAGLAAASMADAGRALYQMLSGFPPVNWSISGRWFLMVFQGEPYVPNIGMAPSLPHEWLAGHIAYYTISLVFAGLYLFCLSQIFHRKPGLGNGLMFGLITLVFPLFVQMPAMGLGVLALNAPTTVLVLLRTLVHHASFGLGLALGAMLAERVFPGRIPSKSG
ncbi:MAG: DUF2938 domain-containing protein [Aestuariivirgaceae bacterium]|nr:DUF2938 domain-containing protein [Aestuariivirgaceae bacterium]